MRGLVLLSVAVALLSLHRGSALAAGSTHPSEVFDASYFKWLLAKEGAAGIEKRLYVAPPDLLSPLLSGVATGEPDWLDVYDRFRKDAGVSSVTRGRLDDALARALVPHPETVLAYLGKHPEISAATLCGRGPNESGVSASVLEPAELLELIRRQQRLAPLARGARRGVRATCLAAASQRLRRQMSIYLVSFGARDARAAGAVKLSAADANDLEVAVAIARRDPDLSARADGSFPDGPFRVRSVPSDALVFCASRPANPEGPWELSDCITDRHLPRSRLLSACQVASEEWDLTCEIGGFSSYVRHGRVRHSGGMWRVLQQQDSMRHAGSQPVEFENWPDCRSLSPFPTSPLPH